MIAGVYSIDADKPSTETDRRVDWLGAFLVTAGLVLIVFVLSDGEVAPHKWNTSCTSSLLDMSSLVLKRLVIQTSSLLS